MMRRIHHHSPRPLHPLLVAATLALVPAALHISPNNPAPRAVASSFVVSSPRTRRPAHSRTHRARALSYRWPAGDGVGAGGGGRYRYNSPRPPCPPRRHDTDTSLSTCSSDALRLRFKRWSGEEDGVSGPGPAKGPGGSGGGGDSSAEGDAKLTKMRDGTVSSWMRSAYRRLARRLSGGGGGGSLWGRRGAESSSTRRRYRNDSDVVEDISDVVTSSISRQGRPAAASVGDPRPNDEVEQRDSKYDDEEEYCWFLDDLGCAALENEAMVVARKEGSDDEDGMNKVQKCRRRIRLQAEPCPEVSSLDSASDVLRKIEEAKEHQRSRSVCRDRGSGHRVVDLYPRHWEEAVGATASIGEKRPTATDDFTFTAMQFNTLAEGLSSGPDQRTPFKMDEEAREREGEKNSGGGNDYGGFTNVPDPKVCLDFNTRRWRLLEVVLQSLPHDVDVDDGAAVANVTGAVTTVGADRPGDDRRPPAEDLGPDLLAMEEVDRYHGFFEPALSKFGYDGLFVSKPSAPGVPLGWYSDGCALFWKRDTFELVRSVEGTYRVNGKQVYLVASLRHIGTGRTVVVAVTHLKARKNAANERIRTLQATELLRVVRKSARDAAEAATGAAGDGAGGDRDGPTPEEDDVPVVMMGDFNTEPCGDGATCIPSLIGRRPAGGEDCRDGDDSNLRRRPLLRSAYPVVPNGPNSSSPRSIAATTSSDALFTTWKTRGKDTAKHVIDYIFHNGDDDDDGDDCGCDDKSPTKNRGGGIGGVRMTCTHTLTIPREDEVAQEQLPGFRYPSDHIMIAARFRIRR